VLVNKEARALLFLWIQTYLCHLTMTRFDSFKIVLKVGIYVYLQYLDQGSWKEIITLLQI